MPLTLTTDPEPPSYPLPGSLPAEAGEAGEAGEHLVALDELRGMVERDLIAAEARRLEVQRTMATAAVRLAERELAAHRRRLAALAHAVAQIEGGRRDRRARAGQAQRGLAPAAGGARRGRAKALGGGRGDDRPPKRATPARTVRRIPALARPRVLVGK